MCASPYSGVIGDVIRYGSKLQEPLLRDAVLFFIEIPERGRPHAVMARANENGQPLL